MLRVSTFTALLIAAAPMFAADTAPTPRFTDPARRAKLEATFPDVEKAFERFREERGIPGLVFGVVIDGDIALVKGLGVRDRKTNDAVTPDTVFRIASMTKSFTAMSILKLRDEGKLALDDPAAKWIPELSRLRYPTRDTRPITIRDLLTHGAGFPEDNPWGDRQLAASEDQLTRWLEDGLPFSTPPDTAFEYSNYGFALLGRIVSKVSGIPYREYVERRILEPLGMKSSTLEPAAVPPAVRATGYRKSGDAYVEEPSLPHGAFGSMGGLLTSGRDLGRYVACFLSAFPPRDEEERGPIRRSSLREMQKPWRAAGFMAGRQSPDSPINAFWSFYGFGLSVRQDCRFNRAVSHGGGLPGFGSTMVWLPDYGVGVFAMANLTYAGPGGPADETLELFRKTGALKPRELPPSPVLLSTRDAIVGLWERWNDDEAKALAADNFFMDAPAADRRGSIERLKAEVGSCRSGETVEPENLLRGHFRMTCERGFIEVYFTLAPTIPPKLQYLGFVPARVFSEKMKKATEALASLVGTFQDDTLASLAGPSLDAGKLKQRLEAVRISYGGCRPGETLSGNGSTNARLRLNCDRGSVDASVRLDEQGRLLDAVFMRSPNVTCGP
jgi:CubicO group peptidase (beta-lactamase class C family)